MKFRLDYVTNSSSSSYTCLICGENICGYDVGLSDGEMSECVNGHIFCDSHKPKQENLKQVAIDLIIENIFEKSNNTDKYYQDKIQKYRMLLEQVVSEEADLEDVLDDLTERCELPEKLCPICTFQSLTDEMIGDYLKKKFNININELKKELVEKFNSYREFEEYCK